MNPGIKKTCNRLKSDGLDSLLVSHPPNISYLTGYISRDSYLLVSNKGGVYITDSRYAEEAKRCLEGIRVEKINGSVFKTIAACCRGLSARRVGFEERYLPYAEYRKIRDGLRPSISLEPVSGIVEDFRQVKDGAELRKINKAIAITIQALKFARGLVRPGKRELEIAGEIERFISNRGARSSAFDIIVASGPNSAYPHHLTSSRKIGEAEPVLFDIGVDYQGYKSDLTRVFFSGKIKSLAAKIYNIVLRAQQEAIKRIKPAVFIKDIDSAARQYIAENGYGGHFGHSLGHGVGLEVHEQPNISGKEEGMLKAGMVFTVEPGIYIAGKFGIRIEDMVMVTGKGVELLSGALDK